MTALPADVLGEIICYVNDLGTINAIARSCKVGAELVRESADHIAESLVESRPPDFNHALSNGVKHGNTVISWDYAMSFTVTYCRGAIVSWILLNEDDAIAIRGHRDTHYVLITPSGGTRFDHRISVCAGGAYHRSCVVNPHRGRRRLERYIIDDVIVPDVIERWGASAMNITQPTQPFVVYCDTEKQASAINEFGVVEARIRAQ